MYRGIKQEQNLSRVVDLIKCGVLFASWPDCMLQILNKLSRQPSATFFCIENHKLPVDMLSYCWSPSEDKLSKQYCKVLLRDINMSTRSSDKVGHWVPRQVFFRDDKACLLLEGNGHSNVYVHPVNIFSNIFLCTYMCYILHISIDE